MRGNLGLLFSQDEQALAPTRFLGQPSIMPEEGGFDLSGRPGDDLMVVGGTPFPTILDLAEFLKPSRLAHDDLVDWCTVVSGHRLAQGQASPLTRNEWGELWRKFDRQRPDNQNSVLK